MLTVFGYRNRLYMMPEFFFSRIYRAVAFMHADIYDRSKYVIIFFLIGSLEEVLGRLMNERILASPPK